MAMVFAAACGATLAFSAMFVWAALVARRPVSPVECPVEDEYGKIVSAGDERLVGGKKWVLEEERASLMLYMCVCVWVFLWYSP